VKGIRNREYSPTDPKTKKRTLTGFDLWVKWGTKESSNPKLAAVARARKSPVQERLEFLDGQHSKATARAESPQASHIFHDTCPSDKPWMRIKTATNMGLDPMMGVIKLASPFFKARKQKN
jgi:hypothetical protein